VFNLFIRIYECLRFLYQEKIHYEGLMEKKVLPDIKLAESEYEELKSTHQVVQVN
jgi:hypothetical protein